MGGRVSRESTLPGLHAWRRVRDYRVYQLQQKANVKLFTASRLAAHDVLALGVTQVAIATGARWRKDGYGRNHQHPIQGTDAAHVYTPDDIMGGKQIQGPVIIYDDDHYYLGGVLAEKLRQEGSEVTLVTPESMVSAWTTNTLEQTFIQTRLIECGVSLMLGQHLTAVHTDSVTIACKYSARPQRLEAVSVVMITARVPVDELYWELQASEKKLEEAGIRQVNRIGDCYGPSTIAAAVYEGHRYARELGQDVSDDIGFRRELTELSSDWERLT